MTLLRAAPAMPLAWKNSRPPVGGGASRLPGPARWWDSQGNSERLAVVPPRS